MLYLDSHTPLRCGKAQVGTVAPAQSKCHPRGALPPSEIPRMENKFIPQAIQIVTEAIKQDNEKNYEKAFDLYKKSLEHFMIGVKCA